MASPSADLDLRTICGALGRVKTKWFAIGIQLGIPRSKLLEFEEERDPLSAMVDYWLNRNVTDPAVSVSWKTIVTTLKSEHVGELGLAKEVNKKYCFQDETSKTGNTTKTTDTSKTKDDDDGDSSASSDSAPLHPDVELDLEQQLNRNARQIKKRFAFFVTSVQTIVEEKGITAKNLSTFLLSLDASTADSGEKLTLLADLKAELKSAEDVADIFFLLSSKYASYLNPDIYVNILEKYGSKEEQKELNYPVHLKDFVKRHTIKEFVKMYPELDNPKLHKIDDNSKAITIKFNIFRTQSLSTLQEVTEAVANILGLRASTLRLHGVRKGCVLVMLLIPTSIANTLFTRDTEFSPEEEGRFRAAKVLWLECNGHKFNLGEKNEPKDTPDLDTTRTDQDVTKKNLDATETDLHITRTNQDAIETDQDTTETDQDPTKTPEYQEHQSSAGPPTGEWTLTRMADSSQLGTMKRIEEKPTKMIQAIPTSPATPKPAYGDSGTGRDPNNQEAERRVEEAERRCREAEKRLGEAMEECKRRVQAAEGRADVAESRAIDLEKRLEESIEEMTRAEQRLALSDESLRQCEEKLQQLKSQWVVERKEIQLTGPELGRGGWATVSVATFRGVQVAAKCIHHQIISGYNISLVEQEMSMAARIRHPNLLQFIGATQRGEPIILTELMPTSLRRELESQQDHDLMSPQQVTSIGVDVARALNYLHLMQPHPLIHRGISSANVLLQPLPNAGWRAKVSDYGTVNLLQELQTVNPGNPTYAAPEACDPTQQSPKMDIFSFGVLMLEMVTGEFPDTHKRVRQLRKIDCSPLLALTRRCLSQERENRPSASDIISELNSLL